MQIASTPIGDQSIPAFPKQSSIFPACLLDIPLPRTIPTSGSRQYVHLPVPSKVTDTAWSGETPVSLQKANTDGMGARMHFEGSPCLLWDCNLNGHTRLLTRLQAGICAPPGDCEVWRKPTGPSIQSHWREGWHCILALSFQADGKVTSGKLCSLTLAP